MDLKRVLPLVALLTCGSVGAAELNLSLGSYHAGRSADSHLNERNPGVAYVADSGLMAGLYKNSYSGMTYYAGYRKEFDNGVGLDLGVASYGNFKWYGSPKILPIGQVTYDVLPHVRVGWVPAYSEDSYFSILTLQLTFGDR